MSSIWNVGGVNPLLVGWYQFINNVDFVGGTGYSVPAQDTTTPVRIFGNSPNAADILGGKGTLFLANPLGTPGDGIMGAALAFSGVGTTRRKAMIAAVQDGATQGVTELDFYVNGSAFISNEVLTRILRLRASGAIQFTPMNGVGNSQLDSGSYTPVATALTNTAAVTTSIQHWMRVGDVVSCTISLSIDPIAGNTQTDFEITLPIPSNLASFRQLTGTISRNPNGITGDVSGVVLGNSVTDRAIIRFYNDAEVSNREWLGTFQYVVA